MLMECKRCKKSIENNNNARYIFCSEGHLVLENKIPRKNIKRQTRLEVGKIIYRRVINKLSNKNVNTGYIYFEGYHIYVDNVRIDEIVDIKIKEILEDKRIIFAKVCNYVKSIGEQDYARKFNCPDERDPIGTGAYNSPSSGGMNRKKSSSVFYPEERIKNKRVNI